MDIATIFWLGFLFAVGAILTIGIPLFTKSHCATARTTAIVLIFSYLLGAFGALLMSIAGVMKVASLFLQAFK